MAIHPLRPEAGTSPAIELQPDFLPFHAQSVEGCLLNLETTLQGLSEEQVAVLRKKHGRKDGSAADLTSRKAVFLNNMKKRVTLLFVAAAALSFYMGHPADGLLILVAMLVNAGVQGLIQWQSLKNQKTYADTDDIRCTVRRGGQSQNVHAGELLHGDVLILSGGQVMPADARLISSYQLQVDESMLTGESVLLPKNAGLILHPMEDVTAQANMLFAGTLIKTGKGEAVVTALGDETVMGRVAAMARGTEKRESPFTRRLNTLSLKVFLFVTLMAAVVIGVGFYKHLPIPQLIQLGLVMAIAGFPETIPGLASLILSLGINRLNAKKVLVKNFQALETVGDINVICTDKTGTLTENYLTLDRIFLPGMGAVDYNPEWQQGENLPCKSMEEFLRIGRLNNGTVVEGLRSPLMGDPIDVALFRAAPASLEAGYHARMYIPFDPVKLRSATICETPDGEMVSMIKGAPESVLETCKYYMKPDGGIGELDIAQRSEFLMHNRKLAAENLRNIGFAQKLMAADNDPYAGAIFIGWVCLLDPPKPGVVEAIAHLQHTGGRLVMITGDQRATAEVIARDLGIIRRASDEVWLRSDLDDLASRADQTDGQPRIPDSVKVFARTKPEEKLAIVESLQRSGNVVAMVGDGVNDSPALQRSDVAIAMGLQGSEAAKESADIILLNDRLEGIMQAMLESRVLRRKVNACIRYLLSCNLGLILFITAATVAGQGLPLTVVQILWLNLVTTMIPALVLAVEPVPEAELTPAAPPEEIPVEEGRESYIDKYKRLEAEASRTHQQVDPLDAGHLVLLGYWGFLIMLAGIGAWFLCTLVLRESTAVAGTVTFCTLALSQSFNLFNVQALNAGENRQNFMTELTSTPITWIVLGAALLLQAATVYLPGLNTLMGTTALPPVSALIPAVLSAIAVLFSLKTMRV